TDEKAIPARQCGYDSEILECRRRSYSNVPGKSCDRGKLKLRIDSCCDPERLEHDGVLSLAEDIAPRLKQGIPRLVVTFRCSFTLKFFHHFPISANLRLFFHVLGRILRPHRWLEDKPELIHPVAKAQ